MTKTADARSYTELEESVRLGDRTITPQMLSDARERDRLAELRAEADELAAANAAEAEHEQALAELRADIESSSVDVERMRELAEVATSAAVQLIEAARARQAQLAGFAARAKRLGCPNGPGIQLAEGEVGWRRFDSGSYVIKVGDRTLGAPDPYALAERLDADVRTRTSLKAVKPGTVNRVAPSSIEDQLDVLDRRPEPAPEPVAIRWVTGGMKIGRIERVSPQHADFYVRRGSAVYA